MRFRNDSASDNLPTCEQLIICHLTVSDSGTAVPKTICTSTMCTAHKKEQELDEKQSSAHVATDVHNTATGRRSQERFDDQSYGRMCLMQCRLFGSC